MFRAVLILIALLPGFAFAAEPLTRAEVESFVGVARDLKALEEKHPDTDIDLGFEDGDAQSIIDTLFDDSGKIQVMGVLMDALEGHDEIKREVDASIAKNGFETPLEFISVGDRVVLAIVRSELNASDLASMKMATQMTSEQMAFLPPEIQAMMSKMKPFAEALEGVPSSDVALVTEYRSDLETLTSR